ncbi:MAG TPA: hypothetical protein VNK91_03970 [Burkholderiaceae bacterium]|jgi:hypothetical protein|nr:hypothetical protein [Burkholderiaceae bacterium]
MAEIENDTLNFVAGRAASPRLTCAARKLAFDEIERALCAAAGESHG